VFPQRLIDGYRSFRMGRYAHEHARYRHLAEAGQRPETMIIACCDSRAAPELIFDAPPGEVFVVRNVANLVPPFKPDGEYHGTSAALEFGLMGLRVRHVVVMGHGRCGGIAAALQENAEPLSPGDFIGKWISLLEAPLAECACHGEMPADERRFLLERVSVVHSLRNLRTFPYVRTLEERGELALHGAWFDISLGVLHAYDEADGGWRALDGASSGA
jgi:carbonic anhydrase